MRMYEVWQRDRDGSPYLLLVTSEQQAAKDACIPAEGDRIVERQWQQINGEVEP